MRSILILITLISGLIFTSFTKNNTRLLDKELTNINDEIIILNSNLAEATLDFEYLTTPKNISFLAGNFLDESFSYYKRSQINDLSEREKVLTNLRKPENYHALSQLNSKDIINKKPYFIKYSTIEKLSFTKEESNEQIEKSKNILHSKKVQRWAGMQVIKAIFGIPTISVK